jgi:hypothetical protein
VLVALLLMVKLGSIQAAWQMTLLLGAGLGIPLLLRWFWRRANAWGELAAVVASGTAAPILLGSIEVEAHRLLLAGLIGTTASVIASIVTPPVNAGQLDEFYQRCRPPGLWGRAEARERFSRGIVKLVACAASLFTALVGLGTLLVGGTPPSFFTHPRIWALLNIGISLSLMPLWWRWTERESSA